MIAYMNQNKSLLNSRILAVMHWLIVASLIPLNPWGSIDTRDFSYMGPYKFWEYNAYIVFVLGAMLILGILLWRGRVGIRTIVWVAAVNALYASMMLFDMLHLFPDPSQPLPPLVWVVEIVTLILSLGILLRVVSSITFIQPENGLH